jgi:hypothetical protein
MAAAADIADINTILEYIGFVVPIQ